MPRLEVEWLQPLAQFLIREMLELWTKANAIITSETPGVEPLRLIRLLRPLMAVGKQLVIFLINYPVSVSVPCATKIEVNDNLLG